jgi:hypothetical protein
MVLPNGVARNMVLPAEYPYEYIRKLSDIINKKIKLIWYAAARDVEGTVNGRTSRDSEERRT